MMIIIIIKKDIFSRDKNFVEFSNMFWFGCFYPSLRAHPPQESIIPNCSVRYLLPFLLFLSLKVWLFHNTPLETHCLRGNACAAQSFAVKKRSFHCWVSRLGHYCQETVQIGSLRALWFEISPLCISHEIDRALSLSLISFILY